VNHEVLTASNETQRRILSNEKIVHGDGTGRWVRVKETGQKLYMNDGQTRFGPGALLLIAQGIVEQIEQQDKPAEPEDPVAHRLRTMVPIDKEVIRIVTDLGLANQAQSYAFIQRYLDLEEAVRRLERVAGVVAVPKVAAARR
jgi:hypothetical protein